MVEVLGPHMTGLCHQEEKTQSHCGVQTADQRPNGGSVMPFGGKQSARGPRDIGCLGGCERPSFEVGKQSPNPAGDEGCCGPVERSGLK